MEHQVSRKVNILLSFWEFLGSLLLKMETFLAIFFLQIEFIDTQNRMVKAVFSVIKEVDEAVGFDTLGNRVIFASWEQVHFIGLFKRKSLLFFIILGFLVGRY